MLALTWSWVVSTALFCSGDESLYHVIVAAGRAPSATQYTTTAVPSITGVSSPVSVTLAGFTIWWIQLQYFYVHFFVLFDIFVHLEARTPRFSFHHLQFWQTTGQWTWSLIPLNDFIFYLVYSLLVSFLLV